MNSAHDRPMLNGHDIEDPLKAAQQRLAEAAMAQPMTPAGATISAYVNGVVNAATLSALLEHCLGEGDFPDAFKTILLRHINAKIDLFQNTAKEAPRIITQQAIAGHG
jgi:hypothetical protein